MTDGVPPIRSETGYEAALTEVERLWGARAGTPEGDRLDMLATLIDAYEDQNYPLDPPEPGGADADIATGRVQVFDDVESFLAYLEKIPLKELDIEEE